MAETTNIIQQQNRRITIQNLAPWQVSFSRKTMNGDVVLPPNGKLFLDETEIMAQCYSNNQLFVGTDGRGAHARIYIEDETLRKTLEFESEDGTQKQLLITDDFLKKIFAYKRQADFEKAIRENVIAHHEKFKLVDFVKTNDINDYKKIRFVEKFVGVDIE